MTQPPTKSANCEYNYSDKIYYSTLEEWCQDAHKVLAKASKWYYQPLKPGGFGFDNMIVSLGYMFQKMNKLNESYAKDFKDPPLITIEQLATWIHEGWSQNYIYWRDKKPWLKKHPGKYKRPSKSLGDDRRNKCAETAFTDLPPDEQEKDLVIARFILHKINEV